MKWFIGTMAALMFTTAQAKQVDLSFQAKRSECRWYEGSFSSQGARDPQREALPKVACRLIDGKGVTCIMKEHGLEEALPKYMKFEGAFVDSGDALELGPDAAPMIADQGPFAFQLKCFRPSDGGVACFMRFWNVRKNIGYSCNLEPWKEAPAPKPPPLLRKPDASTEPYKAPAPIQPDGSYKL